MSASSGFSRNRYITDRQKVQEFQTQVHRWQDEIAFDRELTRLLQKLEAARARILEKSTLLESAESELKRAQAEYDQRLTDRQSSENAAAEVEAELQKLRSSDQSDPAVLPESDSG